MEYKGICPSCRAPLLHTAVARESAAAQVRQQQANQQQRMAALYPATQAAVRLAVPSAAVQLQPPPQPHSPLQAHPVNPPINDDNLVATLALIRQLQAQDAAQLGSLDFGMLNIANGLTGRAAAVPPLGRAPAAATVAGAVEEMQPGAARPIGVISRTLFRISSSSIASWLPSFTFELVRGAGQDELNDRTLAQPALQQPPAPRNAAHADSFDASAYSATAASPVSSQRTVSSASSHTEQSEAKEAGQLSHAPSSLLSSPASSSAESKEDSLSSPPLSPLLSDSHSPISSSTLRLTPFSQRPRRDLMFEAFRRRQSATSSATSPTAAATSHNAALPQLAESSTFVSSLPPFSVGPAAEEAECGDDEKLDSSFDDINQRASNGSVESEWSDEDELVRTISRALDSKQRDVEHSAYSFAQ